MKAMMFAIQELKSKILKLDVSGRPVKWLNWEDAVTLYCKEKVAWEAGEDKMVIKGGFNRLTGERSMLEIDTIIAVKDRSLNYRENATPPLNNRELFRRDQFMCMYCGDAFNAHELTRDHVIPLSQNGPNNWSNVVTACKHCNQRKGGRRPEQANMRLLAVPYLPNHAEYLILSNRTILADQMAFLHRHVPKQRRSFS